MRKRKRFSRVNWEKWDKLIGKMPDAQIAEKIGCSSSAVSVRRRNLDIPAYSKPKPKNEIIECACGCGGTFKKFGKRGRERKFLPSHASRIQPNTFKPVKCDNCGRVFQRPKWQRENGLDYVFCNSKCCGEFASKNKLRAGKNNGHYNTITVNCAGNCGNTVTKAKSLIERRNGNVYCDNCMSLVRKGRKGFYVGYPKEFNSTLRRKIRERDNYTCQECGKQQKRVGYTLHVHHIDYDKHNNSPMNLISLCRKCHGVTNWSTQQWQEKYEALMRHRFPEG